MPSTEALTLASTLPLSYGGLKLPRLGLGVYAMHGHTAVEAVAGALRRGYRLLDTAQMYGNERQVGEGIRASGVPREEIFLVTKLYGGSLSGGERTRRAAQDSLDKLGTYIDLMLLHEPSAGSRARLDSYRVLSEMVDPTKGAIRSLGVSNFGQKQIAELLASPQGQAVRPVVDEIECHVFCQQPELREYLTSQNMAIMAYCPLAQTSFLRDSTLHRVAKEINATPAQTMLRWIIQQNNVVPIPKSANASRQQENAAALDSKFTLSEQQLQALASLDRGMGGVVDGWASYQS